MMLSDALDEYLTVRKRQVKARTLGNETQALKVFLAEIGNIQLKNLTANHIVNFFYSGRDENLQPSSFNVMLQHVRLFLAFCQRRKYLKRDLMEDIRARKEIKRERMRLSPSQLLGLLEVAACERDRGFLAVAMNTGLRAGDICELRIGDVNLDAGKIRCQVSKSDVEDLKPISADLDKELRRWLLHYEATEKDTYRQKLQPDWYLFPSHAVWNTPDDWPGGKREGERLFPERKMAVPHRAVKRALKELGLDGPGEGVHTIRRSVARAYFESLRAQGYDGALQATKEFLNHANAQITEQYLGLTHERQIRDETIAGKPFLSAMTEADNIVNIADWKAK